MKDSLIKYSNLPKLTGEEHLEYIKLYYSTGEIKYRDIVLNSCLLLAAKEAYKFIGFLKNSSLTHEDLIQAANIGLIKSLENKRFKLEKNRPYIPYALIWIRGELKKIVGLDTFRHISPPNVDFATRAMAFNRGLMAQLSENRDKESYDLLIKQTATRYKKITEKQVEDFSKYLKNYKKIQRISEENENLLKDESNILEKIETKRDIKKISKIIQSLPPGQKEILLKKYFLSSGVEGDANIARSLNITRQAVSARKMTAFNNIRKKLDLDNE